MGPQVYPIFIIEDSSIPVGSTGYKQLGKFGTPLGLLVSLTMTPQFIKVIQTDHGFRRIYV